MKINVSIFEEKKNLCRGKMNALVSQFFAGLKRHTVQWREEIGLAAASIIFTVLTVCTSQRDSITFTKTWGAYLTASALGKILPISQLWTHLSLSPFWGLWGRMSGTSQLQPFEVPLIFKACGAFWIITAPSNATQATLQINLLQWTCLLLQCANVSLPLRKGVHGISIAKENKILSMEPWRRKTVRYLNLTISF